MAIHSVFERLCCLTNILFVTMFTGDSIYEVGGHAIGGSIFDSLYFVLSNSAIDDIFESNVRTYFTS